MPSHHSLSCLLTKSFLNSLCVISLFVPCVSAQTATGETVSEFRASNWSDTRGDRVCASIAPATRGEQQVTGPACPGVSRCGERKMHFTQIWGERVQVWEVGACLICYQTSSWTRWQRKTQIQAGVSGRERAHGIWEDAEESGAFEMREHQAGPTSE